MEQPKKKVLLTAKRVKEVADSLEKEAKDKWHSSYDSKKYGNPEHAKAFKEDGDTDMSNSIRYKFLAAEAESKDKEKTKKQVQDQEMMKEKLRQRKSNDKSSVIKLMRKIVG